MAAIKSVERSLEERDRLADKIFLRRVKPSLAQADLGKYVAISINSEDFEIDADEHAAITHLLDREPGADIWLLRAGEPATYRI